VRKGKCNGVPPPHEVNGSMFDRAPTEDGTIGDVDLVMFKILEFLPDSSVRKCPQRG
jgi:hypothetical protein